MIGTSQVQAAAWNGTVWARQTTPVPDGASLSSLSGVACPGASTCFAVGSATDGMNVKHALAMAWNGSAWTVSTVSEPSGTKASWLTDLACTSASACKAVGTYVNSSNARQTLAISFNGGSWSVASSPNIGGSKSNDLSSISCSSATSCFAVGNYADSTGVTKPLALSWNGTSWSTSSIPIPSGATFGSLSGVSCLTNNCKAVGSYFDSVGIQKSFAVQWLGSTWTIMSAPEPSGTSSQLKAISCSSASVCSAVGTFHKGQDDLPHALWWNGTSWSLQSVDISSVGAVGSDLTAVACLTQTFCHASGSIVYGHVAANRNLALRYDGTGWALTEAGGYERTWSDQSPGQSGAAERMGLACASLSWCIRVGTYQRGRDVERAFIQRWTGFTWAAQYVPFPAGAKSTALEGVACRSTSDCVAVGVYLDSTGSERSLSVTWNGTAWSSGTTPAPSGSLASHLSGVSCVTGSCAAVGRYVDSGGEKRALAMSWNGTAWSIASTPTVSGAVGVSLQDVSCTSTALCKAVGIFEDGNTTHQLALDWNGSAWSIASLPAEPTGALGTALTGISCAGPTFCSTVGSYRDPSGIVHGLNLRWSGGTSWSAISLPSPGESRWTKLFGVDCISPSACVAVGEYADEAGHRQGLVLNGTGGAWTLGRAPEPAKTDEWSLRSIACLSGTGCMAIGDHLDNWATRRVIVANWSGATWAVDSSAEPSGASSGELRDVFCFASASCVAVGKATVSGAAGPFSATGYPGDWTIASTPKPAGASATELVDVHCSSATGCTAVGNYTSSGVKKSLAMEWNGTAWSIASVPSPAGATASELTGVACVSAISCTAVGDYTLSGVKKTLAMSWNGSAWSVVATPAPGGSTVPSELQAVSCTATNFCMATGTYTESTAKNLAMKWNGTSWSAVAIPINSESKGSALTGVACTSTTWCAAVGYDTISTERKTRGVIWNGTVWTTVGTPNGLSGYGSELRDVTCTSSTSCVAVGVSQVSGIPLTELIQAWNGTAWANSTVEEPYPFSGASPQGVSCGTYGGSTSPCLAVGNFSDEKVQKRALVQIWGAELDNRGEMSGLAGITCLQAGCMAVGRIESGLADRTEVAWQLEDSGWTAQAMPGVREGSLLDVACASLSSCTAVGSQAAGTLAERWDGIQWSVLPTPNPTGSAHSLAGLSCPSSNSCVAVGRYTSASKAVVLIEVWNGTSWSTQTAPLPAGATQAWLEDVSCPASNSCMAVGTYKDASGVKRPLGERWNGTVWSVVTVADAPASAGTEVMGVDCQSNTSCKAVGQYTIGVSSYPLSVSWNGTSWNQLAIPAPENATATYLSDVSCFGQGRCVAVGHYQAKEASGFHTLAMSWNGTGWYVEPTPNRANGISTPNSKLSAISCPAAADCAAVGTSFDSGTQTDLALSTPDISATPESGEPALELTDPAPTLTEEQVEEAQTLIAADPAFQSAIQGDNYAMTVGPWTETTATQTTNLVGVTATVAMVTPHDWEDRVWPVIGYDLEDPSYYAEGTYLEAEMKAAATEVTTLIVQLDAETDVNGNLVGGEVVMIEPVADEAGEVTYSPETLEGFEIDPNGWEY